MSTPNADDPPKHAEKSTMQEPQEEFIADASVPSHSGTPPSQNPVKDPDQETIGRKPMSGSQKSKLEKLSRETGEGGG